MAPKSKFKNLSINKLRFLSLITLFGVVLIVPVNAKESSDCFSPRCVHFQKNNFTNPVKVFSSDPSKEKVVLTTFCYDGSQKSLLCLWANPALRIIQKDVPPNEGSKFLTYYGISKADVDFRSKQPGYAILQNWAASLRTLRQTEDFSLNPFNVSCIGIETNVDYTARINIKAIDLWYVTYLVAGVVIFFSAKTWSQDRGANMFNYQCEWILHLSTMVANTTSDWRLADMVGLSGFTADAAYPEWPPFRRSVAFIGDFMAQWRHKYTEFYNRIHPQIDTWIRNTTLHYGTGVSVGVMASLIVLVFIVARFLPSRLKTIGYVLMLTGTSMAFWLLSSLSRIVSDNMVDNLVSYWQYVLAYCVCTGLLSFAVVYRYGPVTNERTLSLIQWLLQIIGLVLIYNSSQIQEVSIALVILTLTVYNFPRTFLFNRTSRKYWNRFFPSRPKLLTEDEFNAQGNAETTRALEQLREYCRSPECKSWTIISKLKSPQRFADFIEGNSWHVSNEELLEYDSETDLLPPHEMSGEANLGDDSESEMDFILSSP